MLEQLQKNKYVSGEIIANFLGSSFFRRERYSNRVIGASRCGGDLEMSRLRNLSVLLHVRVCGDSPVSLTMIHIAVEERAKRA